MCTFQNLKLTTIVFSTLLLAACGSQPGGHVSAPEQTDTTAPLSQPSPIDFNQYPLNKVVCDPFQDETSQTGLRQGLIAELFWLGAGQAPYTHAADYASHGVRSEQVLFFNDINIPTRKFDTGFANALSQPLKNDSGAVLIEYFGLRMESVLKLSPEQEEGDYELAVLSDDGALVNILTQGFWKPLINNDGDHPTRMGCSNKTLHFDHNTEYPIEIFYYQGPRYHISNVLMWRKSSTAGTDPSCGQEGNLMYFDYYHQSAPMAAYNGLLARGWSVISHNNFNLPGTVEYNPCHNGAAPVISGFQINEVFSDLVTVQFDTDIPGTAQMKITDMATGKVTLTNNDNALTTHHSFEVSGLVPDHDYLLQAISISADYGKGFSNELSVHTSP